MQNLLSFENYIGAHSMPLFEASNLAKIQGMPKEMVSAIHQKEEHRSEKYKSLGKVLMGGAPVTLEYTSFRPSHDIEIPAPITFTGRKVPPPEGVDRTAWYTDFAQYLQDLPNGPLSVLIARPEDDIFLYLYYKKKWGGGPNKGGQQYAIIVWDREVKKAHDFGFYLLTVDAVEQARVRQVHHKKGGNTNAKVQEYVSSLAEGAPRRNKPVLAYEFEVTQAPRETRQARKAAAQIMSIDLIRVFANRYAKIIDEAKPELKSRLRNEISEMRTPYPERVPKYSEIQNFARSLGSDYEATTSFLYKKMRDFRSDLFKAGGGAYRPTSGFDLEDEKNFSSNLVQWRDQYELETDWDPKDTRRYSWEQRGRDISSEKAKRVLPKPGEYAAIDSMIKTHSLDNTLHKFMFYLMTGRIDSPAVNVLALLGIDADSEDLQGLPDFETWTL